MYYVPIPINHFIATYICCEQETRILFDYKNRKWAEDAYIKELYRFLKSIKDQQTSEDVHSASFTASKLNFVVIITVKGQTILCLRPRI